MTCALAHARFSKLRNVVAKKPLILNNNHVHLSSNIRRLLACFLCLVSCACVAVEPIATKSNSTTLQASQLQPGTHLSSIASTEESWSERAQEVLMNALSLTGIHYKYGGSSPETGFDCSGFVRYVFNQAASLSLPRSTLEISRLGVQVAKNELQPGDLVFFNTMRSAFSHVGIYVGNNRFIHAPSSGGGVRVESMQQDYWLERFNGAKRIDMAK
jgi:cell wall-associated NlpC family hydrolase